MYAPSMPTPTASAIVPSAPPIDPSAEGGAGRGCAGGRIPGKGRFGTLVAMSMPLVVMVLFLLAAAAVFATIIFVIAALPALPLAIMIMTIAAAAAAVRPGACIRLAITKERRAKEHCDRADPTPEEEVLLLIVRKRHVRPPSSASEPMET